MDGTSRTVLHNTGLTFPSGITLDYTSQTLYWIDAAGFRIESSAVDGSNRQTVTSVNVNINPWGIVYYSGNLYWTDRNSNRSLIYTSSARFPSPRNLLSGFTLNFFPLGIEVVSSSRQLQGKLLLLRVRQSGGAWFGSCCHTYWATGVFLCIVWHIIRSSLGMEACCCMNDVQKTNLWPVYIAAFSVYSGGLTWWMNVVPNIFHKLYLPTCNVWPFCPEVP